MGRNILGIDIVRFFAAALVMVFHLGFWSWWEGGEAVGTIHRHYPNLPHFPELISLSWFGWVGVQVFFVISGYVISISAANKEPKQFLQSRLLRIYPTVWVSALAIFGVSLIFSDDSMPTVFMRLLNTLLISPIPFWVDGVFWTLVVELVFYGMIAATLFVFGYAKLEVFAHLLGMFSSIFLVGAALGFYELSWFFSVALMQHGVFFALGMLLYFITKEGGGGNNFRKPGFILVLLFSCVEIYLVAEKKQSALNIQENSLVPIIVWLFFLVVIVCSITYARGVQRFVAGGSGVVRTLGLMTFPLYLIHSLIGGAVMHIMVAIGSSGYLSLVAGLSVSLFLSWRLVKIESVLTNFLKKLMRI